VGDGAAWGEYMSFSHSFNEKSSFESGRPDRHILAYQSHSLKESRHQMFKAYPLYMTGRNEHRSSGRGFWSTLLRLLGRGHSF
jgi:hypothetical protein